MFEFNQDSVPKMMSGLYWSITAAMSAVLFLALRQFIVMQVSFRLLFFGTSFNLLLLLFRLESSDLSECDGNIPELDKELGKTSESEEYDFEFCLPHFGHNYVQNERDKMLM